MSKNHIKTGDTVIVLSGKDKGKKGRVISMLSNGEKVVIEGVNMVTKNKKPRRATEVGGQIKQEAPIYSSKAMHVCNSCHEPTRVGRKVLDGGTIVRYCKKCGDTFEK